MPEIRFTYRPTEDHLLWLLRANCRSRHLTIYVAGLLMLAVGLLTMANNSRSWPIYLLGSAVILAMPSLMIRITARRVSALIVSSDREVALSDTGIEVTTSVTRCWYARSLISNITRDKHGWIILASGNVATMIPREVLTTEQTDAVEQFAAAFSRQVTAG